MDEHKQQLSRAIEKALKSFFHKLSITFNLSAVIENLEFFYNLSKSGVFLINDTSVEELTRIMESKKWSQENRTFFIELGRSFTPGFLSEGRLAKAIKEAKAISN